ncbi:hypothetical protein ZWY2020_003302 [Hordeum vulgare]|nr:hypothetical protein ZWY2020_003302 [Hordeum vulgare]
MTKSTRPPRSVATREAHTQRRRSKFEENAANAASQSSSCSSAKTKELAALLQPSISMVLDPLDSIAGGSRLVTAPTLTSPQHQEDEMMRRPRLLVSGVALTIYKKRITL